MSSAGAAVDTGDSPVPGAHPRQPAAAPLDVAERRQLRRLRRWGTVGALLMMVGSSSSYGAATPIPNPLDGLRVLGLLSRLGPPALACSYTGIGLVVACWFLIGRLATPGRARRLSRTQLTHTLAMWAVPFLVTPPIFSRDVYSYLAVGSMLLHGHNPYEQGPVDALGDDNALAHQVDGRWQHTTSPYGPVFLLVARAVVLITGEQVVWGVLLQRLVEGIGVLLIVAVLPRLARRCGIDPVGALWLGVLNPLVLFHLIAGGHNEALMLGLMLAGLVLALGPPDAVPPWWRLPAGTVVITAAVGIKATAAMALAFLAVALARRAGGRWRDLMRSAAVIAATAVIAFALFTLAAGVGFGWVSALTTPGSVRSFLSVSTACAIGAGWIGLLLGLGDHTTGIIDVLQPVGSAVGAVLALVLLWRCWRPGRTGRAISEPIRGLGLALGAFVLLGPVIQPWYLLWAALPLAASTGLSRDRRAAVWLTTVFAVIIMPNGATIPVFTIVATVAVAAVVTGAVLLRIRGQGWPTHQVEDHATDPRPAAYPGMS